MRREFFVKRPLLEGEGGMAFQAGRGTEIRMKKVIRDGRTA